MQKMTEINPDRVYSVTFLNQHTLLCHLSHVFFQLVCSSNKAKLIFNWVTLAMNYYKFVSMLIHIV